MFRLSMGIVRKTQSVCIPCIRSLTKKQLFEYKIDSPERKALEGALQHLSKEESQVPSVVGYQEIFTGDQQYQRMPHNHQRILAKLSYSKKAQINIAIRDAMTAREEWRIVPASERAAIWCRCADIIEKEDRHLLNAAIILGQAKPNHEAELDTCRLIEALRSNANSLQKIDQMKIKSFDPNITNASFQLRPLDGFVAAIGPFNETHTSANIAFCPALVGNCVLWKPSDYCTLSSYIVYRALLKAGLPPGVISFMPTNSALFLESIAMSPLMGGINFTGTVETFRNIWNKVAVHMKDYSCFPRLMADCGGKNFHFVHESADLDTVVNSTVCSAFEYSGQKSNACSRLYVPSSMWPDIRGALEEQICAMKIASPCDFKTFTSAVVNEVAYDRIVAYLDYAQKSAAVDVICGGDSCKTLGYFIQPTVLQCRDPFDRLMREIIFGPILSVYVYKNETMNETLELIGKTCGTALSGGIFATDDNIICQALKTLSMAASNMYINEKSTGGVERQMPLSGNRLSGSNDRLGSVYYLLRWSSPQLIQENATVRVAKANGPNKF